MVYSDELLIYPPLVTHCLLFIHGHKKRHQITISTNKEKYQKAQNFEKRQTELDLKNFMTANKKLSMCKKLIFVSASPESKKGTKKRFLGPRKCSRDEK